MKAFEKLMQIVSDLRDETNGCPWDRKQTPKSLVPNFIEELYEVIEAIEDEDDEAMREELGDLMLHLVFQVQIAQEQGKFGMEDVLDAINNKLVRRHPHIFGDERVDTADKVKLNWELIKKKEKKDRKSVLDGIPRSMPALIQAWRLQEKAASVGFDWQELPPVCDKIQEEHTELMEALKSGVKADIEEELGDLIFSIVNLARKLDIDAEAALKATNRKFYNRFQYIEAQYKDTDINEADLDELDTHWKKAKEH
ncbi:MAG: nucleoside triphosphate pyrophosphohydrolase [Candidatus Cloacimonetes bacterium]|jgi:tetrapyrrole methylase family protein/MazG family protein|nr:nucleoside triphosphate pyrophosphohydrolase [Candidatus Cloacimonadota bacterium]NLO44231.1 nucleoside triphosphate pyrophosphohydrolase [Candidatus Cloacimonadota bacterium]